MRLSIATVSLLLSTGCYTTAEQSARAKEPAQVIKPDPDGVQRVRILAGGYFFKPSHIVVKVNTPVEILASRESGMVPHDLVIDAPEAGIAVKQDLATEPRRVAFTPKRVGSYAIYCSKKPPLGGASHRERGMEGVLEVVP